MTGEENIVWPKFANLVDQASLWVGDLPLYDWQVDLLNAAQQPHSRALLSSNNEAQPVDTMIPTPMGLRRLGDLKTHEKVFTHTGRQSKISYVFDQGMKMVYRITFDNGEVSTLATEDHLWMYIPHHRRFNVAANRRYQIMRTREMLAIQGEHSIPLKRGCIPVCKPAQYHKKRFKIAPYLMGALLGGGGMPKNSTVIITSADKEVLDRIRTMLPFGISLKHNAKYSYRLSGGKKCKSNHLTQAIRALGLEGHRSWEKFIPAEYLMGSVEQRIELLKGLMDTDGCISKKRCYMEFSTTSDQLKDGIMDLVRSLGGKACACQRVTRFTGTDGRKKDGRPSWRVKIKHPTINPFHLRRKAIRWYPISIKPERLVYSIEPVGMMECRCIKIGNGDDTYLTNDYIVTHNSGKSSLLAVIFLFGIAAAFKGAMCHATSGNEEQLRAQLFALLKERAMLHGWKVNESQMLITLPNDSTIRCTVKQDARSVEGFHGYTDPRGWYRPCAYFIDEAKHVQNAKEEAIRRIDPDFYLACSTPPTSQDIEYDWFWKGIDYDHLEKTVLNRRKQFNIPSTNDVWTKTPETMLEPDPIHSFPGEYFTYRLIVTWNETPHLRTPAKKRERDNIIKKFGINSAFVRSMLFGLATDGDVELPIFNEEDITLMRRAMAGEFGPLPGDTRAAADVSGTGKSDPMVIGLRHGTEVMHIKECRNMDDIAQAEYIVHFCKTIQISPFQLCIDGMGIGASVANRIEQTLFFSGITRFLSNNHPTFNFQFADRYTEIHWTIKDLLAHQILRVPWCPDLLRDMRQRQYVMMPSGKIKTEPKQAHRKRTGVSPDFLDLIVYLFADIPIHRIRRGERMKNDRRPDTDMDRPWNDGHSQQAHLHGKIMAGLSTQPSLASLLMAQNGQDNHSHS